MSQEPTLTIRSFRGVSLAYYPPGLVVIPFAGVGVVIWFVLTGGIFAPVLISNTGVAGFLLIPVIAGGAVAGLGIWSTIKSMLLVHGLDFLPLTMDLSEEDPTITIPFVGKLEMAPLNIPGLTAPLVREVEVPENGGTTIQKVEEAPVTKLGDLHVFQARLSIPQPIKFPKFWTKFEDPVEKAFFVSRWPLNVINRKFPAWVGYKRLLTTAANVLPLYVNLIRGKPYVQNSKPVPVFWISGCKGPTREVQLAAKVKYLTAEDFKQLESAIGAGIAYEERFKREMSEAEIAVLKQTRPDLEWKAGVLSHDLRQWTDDAMDTKQPGNLRKWLGSKTGAAVIVTIVIVVGIVVAVASHR